MTHTVHPRQILDAVIANKSLTILKAVEAIPDPQTYQDAERAAKALIALSRLVDKVYPEAPVADAEPIDISDIKPSTPRVAPNRHQRRKAMAQARATDSRSPP